MVTSTLAPLATIQARHEQRQMQQKEQLSTNSMPQKHESLRSRQRMYEIQMYEEELKLQEARDCSMSEHERQILIRSFASVKFEFSDLDGLTWSPSAKRRRLYSAMPVHCPIYSRNRTQSESGPFAVLSNADFLSTNPEDTIRPSSSLPAILATSFRSHFRARDTRNRLQTEDLEFGDDEDPTPMSTPTQADFTIPQSFALRRTDTSRSLQLSPMPDVDKLILVDRPSTPSSTRSESVTTAQPVPLSYFDDQPSLIAPVMREKRRFRVRLPVKHHGAAPAEKDKP